VRINSNVEAADKLPVVQAIITTAVRLSNTDDNEAMIVGQHMFLGGKRNCVPALRLAVVVPLDLGLLCGNTPAHGA